MEQLEPRSLLDGSAGIALPSQTANSPPVITLAAIHSVGDIWTLRGTVTAKGESVAGLQVKFGGTLTKFHLAATVQANGAYSITEILPQVTRGTATAETHDSHGTASNVAMTYIISDYTGMEAGVVVTGLSDEQQVVTPSSPYSPSPTAESLPPGNIAQTTDATVPPLSGGVSAGSGPGATIATVAGACRYLGDGGTAAAASLNSPKAWPWTARATCSSPTPRTTSSAKCIPPPALSPRWRETGSAATTATAGRPPAPN